MISSITNHNVENFLKCVRNGENPPAILLKLSLLQQPGLQTSEARGIKLAEILQDLATESYLRARHSENLPDGLPETRNDWTRQIAEDFSLGNVALESWSSLFFRYFSTITSSVEDLSSAANVVPQQFRRRLNQGLSYLVDLLRKNELSVETHQNLSSRNLPLPDFTRLVGVQPILEQLSNILNHQDGPRLVSVEGIGGIGKTAAVRAFVSLPETTALWKNILWVSARQIALDDSGRLSTVPNAASTLEDITNRLADQMGINSLASKTRAEKMERLQAALNLQPSLVVIDNLETVDDSSELVPALAKLAGNSKFLITSRQTLRSFPFVHVVQMSELDGKSSFELLEIEESRRGRESGVQKEEFDDLYSVIGGIPLAIKLVAA